MAGVKRAKESVIKQMEKSESKAEVYTASNYRLAEIGRGIESAKMSFQSDIGVRFRQKSINQKFRRIAKKTSSRKMKKSTKTSSNMTCSRLLNYRNFSQNHFIW